MSGLDGRGSCKEIGLHNMFSPWPFLCNIFAVYMTRLFSFDIGVYRPIR